jgi:hypothetical protein
MRAAWLGEFSLESTAKLLVCDGIATWGNDQEDRKAVILIKLTEGEPDELAA